MKPSSRKLRLQSKQLTFNWGLFFVLLHAILLFRLIHIFGVLVGDRCIGHHNYWLGENVLGLSMYDTLTVVFLLCLLWSLIDLVVFVMSQPPRKIHLLLLTLCMASTAIICISTITEMARTSPFIASLQQGIQACLY